jgi:glutaredoxin
MWNRLWNWWRGRAPVQRSDLTFTLYTREGCHLCEVAHELLEQEKRQHGFQLEVVDIDTSAELTELYGEQVPVVCVNGKLRFRGRINPVLLRRLYENAPARE